MIMALDSSLYEAFNSSKYLEKKKMGLFSFFCWTLVFQMF